MYRKGVRIIRNSPLCILLSFQPCTMPMTNKPNIAKRIDKVVKMIWLSLPKLILIGKSSRVGLVCISGNNSTPLQIAKRKKAIRERQNINF